MQTAQLCVRYSGAQTCLCLLCICTSPGLAWLSLTSAFPEVSSVPPWESFPWEFLEMRYSSLLASISKHSFLCCIQAFQVFSPDLMSQLKCFSLQNALPAGHLCQALPYRWNKCYRLGELVFVCLFVCWGRGLSFCFLFFLLNISSSEIDSSFVVLCL